MLLTELAPLVMAERLAIATLIGLVVGTEREWSAPAPGPHRRFAGLRTFLLLGILGGVAGLLAEANATWLAAMLLAGGAGIVVAAYVDAMRRTAQAPDGTTEAAALVVLGLAVMAALGYESLATGCAAVVVFALGEKQRLHWLVGRIGQTEMHAALQFLVLALVILPLLPAGPYAAFFDIRPRALWAIVLLLTAINFGGYLARRAVGPGRGYGVTGALAGLISSTALTLQFARISRTEPQYSRGLSLGVIAACTVLPIRILAISLVLNPAVARAMLYYTIPAVVIGAAFTALLFRNSASSEKPAADPRSPLNLVSALQLALLFEVAFIIIGFARTQWGSSGVIGSAVVLGLADLDALTASMNHFVGGANAAALAARAIGIGLLTNTVVKLVIAMTAGEANFKRQTFAGLAFSAAGIGAALWWRW